MKSQNERLLQHFEQGHAIDPLTALRKLGIMRLASRVHDLRKTGHTVVSERKKVRNRYGEECVICMYKLMESTP